MDSCPPPEGRCYGAALPVTPVVLAKPKSITKKTVTAALPEDFRLKAPTVPKAPDGLPPEFEFCVQENGMFIRHRDVNHRLHGAHISGTCMDDEETGLRMCRVDVGGDAEIWVPACVDPGVEKEPVPDICCVDTSTATLVCPGSSYDGLVVEVLEETEQEHGGVVIISVQHPDLPGGGARVPVCTSMEPEEEEPPCCINERTGQLVCPERSPLFPYDGIEIPKQYLECKTVDGRRICKVKCGKVGEPKSDVEGFLQHICKTTGHTTFPTCDVPGDRPKIPVPREPKKPPKKVPVPQLCCYNPHTGSLVCEGTPYDGLVVKVVTQTTLPNGKEIVSVSHPSLPGGGARVPLCPGTPPQRRPVPKPKRPPVVKIPEPEFEPPKRRPPPPAKEPTPRPRLPVPSFLPDHCCFDMATGRIVCEDTEYNGLAARVLSIGHIQDGVGMVLLEHSKFVGGRASIPICPGSCYEPPAHHCDVSACDVCNPPKQRRYGANCNAPEDPCYTAECDVCNRRYGATGCNAPEDPCYTADCDICTRRYGISLDPNEVALQSERSRWIQSRNQGFSRNSKGWKPDIRTLHQARIPPSPWGALGFQNPPNISGDEHGFNTTLFRTWKDVDSVLQELGYPGREDAFEFSGTLRQFQAHYNQVSQAVALNADDTPWVRVPKGNLVADGFAGPITLNALEIALVNQRGGVSWEHAVLSAVRDDWDVPDEREHLYNAREPWANKSQDRRYGVPKSPPIIMGSRPLPPISSHRSRRMSRRK